MYCDKNNFIFVHIPKTGGSTVEQLLLPYVSDKITVRLRPEKERAWDDDIELHINQRGIPHTKHWTLGEHIKQCALTNRIDDIFKFTVVRNPYERMFKLFLFKLQHGEFRPLPGEPGEKESRTQYRGKHITDAILNNWRHSMFTDFLEQKRDMIRMGMRTYLSAFQMCEMYGEVKMDYILRYENFEEDIKVLFEKLNLPAPAEIPVTNSTRPISNDDLKHFYNDHNRSLVERFFSRDFEEFGYTKWTQ